MQTFYTHFLSFQFAFLSQSYVITLPCAPPHPPSSLLQRHLCPERPTCVDCINRLLYSPDSGWVQPIGRPGRRSGEKRRVGRNLCLSTTGHNAYQRYPLFMILLLKFPVIASSSCSHRPRAGKGAHGYCTSMIPLFLPTPL